MYLPHMIALQASLAPRTLMFINCIYHLFQHTIQVILWGDSRIWIPGLVCKAAIASPSILLLLSSQKWGREGRALYK